MSLFKSHKALTEAVASKTIEPAHLDEAIENIRDASKTIATLNGSFDLMHGGHLEMIFQASRQADVLIVMLNTDRSIKAYKSSERPIIPLEYRMSMMASLIMVDYVTWFDETDPRQILSRIKPDVHVNGAEYGTECIEAPVVLSHGGKIHIVELVPGLSTSQIIKKIVATCV